MAETAGVTEHFEVVSNNKTSIQNTSFPNHLKIIKSAKVRYKVKNVKKATAQIKQMAYGYNAYISDMTFENNLHSLENRFTVKVPKESFGFLMDSIAKVAEFIDYESIATEDITENYVDVEARLKTKQAVKVRYENILVSKAKTVKDILATEEKLRVIQEEIEAAEGKLNYWSNKVAFSTIQIDLYETVNYKEEPSSYNKSFWAKGKKGITFGWRFVENTILAIIHIWPILLLGIGILFFFKRRRK